MASVGANPPIRSLDASAVASVGANPPIRTFDASAAASVGANPPIRTLDASTVGANPPIWTAAVAIEEPREEEMKPDIGVTFL